jgi:hypothetical protein
MRFLSQQALDELLLSKLRLRTAIATKKKNKEND